MKEIKQNFYDFIKVTTVNLTFVESQDALNRGIQLFMEFINF